MRIDRRGSVRRGTLAALTAALVASAVLVAFPTGAGADTAAPVVGGSWYWREQPARSITTPAGTPVGTPAALPAPDVPAGDYAVAVKTGDPASGTDVSDDKESFLHIDTTTIPTGSTISRFVLKLKEDAGAQQVNAASASIKAYPVTGFFTDGGAALSWSDRPTFDPALGEGAGTRAADGTWTFDLTAIVSKWVAGTVGNNGLALAPAGVTAGSPPFQIVWSGTMPKPTTDGSFTPPASTTGTTETTVGTETTTPPFVAPVTITPDVSTPVIAPAAPAPVVRPPSTGNALGARPLRRIVEGRPKRTIPVAAIGAVLAVVAFIGAGMVALGEAGEPVTERRGSVLRALEHRLNETA